MPLELSGLEVVFLTDSIRNADAAEGRASEGYVPLAREVLLLLGSAYCALVTDAFIEAGPAVLQVTEEQAWLLRGKVRTGDMAIDGKTIIGPRLLRKLYTLLGAFTSGLDWLQPEVLLDSPKMYARVIISEEVVEVADAPGETSPSTSKDDSASPEPAGDGDGAGGVSSRPVETVSGPEDQDYADA